MSRIQDLTISLQGRIYAEDYYPTLWDRALMKHNCSVATIDQHKETDRTCVALANTFWALLPDSPVIHTGPFNALCDLCVEDYREPDDEAV